MRAPPPTAKGVVTIEQIVDTLPDRGRSCWHLGAVWALSQFQENEVRRGLLEVVQVTAVSTDSPAQGSGAQALAGFLQPRTLTSKVELLGAGWHTPGPQPGSEPRMDWQWRAQALFQVIREGCVLAPLNTPPSF